MCKYFTDCQYCMSDKKKCECMGDGSPFCHDFKCCIPYSTGKDCKKECITYDELIAVYRDHF